MQFLAPIIGLVQIVLEIYTFIIIAQVILSWLVAFNVINTTNRIVYMIGDFLYRVTEPVMAPVRRVLPNLGPVDLSPIVVLLVIWFIQYELQILQHSLLAS